jgi:hypothetical protein
MNKTVKILKIIILSLVVVLLLAQFIRIDKSNPPVRSDLASGSAKPLLHRACYNCHSNETIWPWYASVAPASWLVGRDVREARSHLNFSEWGTYDSGTRSHKLRGIAEEVRGGDMPPWYYSFVHRDSRLSASERNQILAWVAETISSETK